MSSGIHCMKDVKQSNFTFIFHFQKIKSSSTLHIKVAELSGSLSRVLQYMSPHKGKKGRWKHTYTPRGK